MNRNTTIALGAALALGAGGAGVATALGSDDGGADGPGAARAKAAALAITGGTANAVERDGEDGATWEVEVAKPDGTTVDVRLDAAYRLVVVERDGEDRGEGTGR